MRWKILMTRNAFDTFFLDELNHFFFTNSGNRVNACSRGGYWWCGYYNSIDTGRVNKLALFSNNGFRTVKQEVKE